MAMQYDVIIVGAGSVGCPLAARVFEDPNISALLLEAGPDYHDLASLPDELKYGYTRDAELNGAPHNWSLTGTSNSVLGDVSIIPSLTRANTNATAIMIGEKLADWFKEGK